eukprot:SAG31_NODE_9990_length_1200_cov_1.531335_2_plen_184_part_00
MRCCCQQTTAASLIEAGCGLLAQAHGSGDPPEMPTEKEMLRNRRSKEVPKRLQLCGLSNSAPPSAYPARANVRWRVPSHRWGMCLSVCRRQHGAAQRRLNEAMRLLTFAWSQPIISWHATILQPRPSESSRRRDRGTTCTTCRHVDIDVRAPRAARALAYIFKKYIVPRPAASKPLELPTVGT